MKRIDRKGILLIIGLLVVVIGLALLRDLRGLHSVGSSAGVLRQFPFRQQLLRQLLPVRTVGLANTIRLLAGITATLGCGILCQMLLPQRFDRMVKLLERRGSAALFLGITLSVTTIFLAALAALSVVGALFVPVLTLAVLAAGALGVLVVVARLGNWLRGHIHSDPHPLADLITGVLLLSFALVLPIGGRLLLIAATIWGLGVVALSRAGSDD